MTRKFIIFFSFLALSTACYSKNKLVVAFNMNECPTCYNNLSNLRFIDTANIQLIFVFEQKYREDSAAMVSKYDLNRHAKYVWSDSLSKALRIDGFFSTVIFYNSNGSKRFHIRLKHTFVPLIAKYLNRLAKPVDTFDLQGNYFTSGVKTPLYKNNRVYFINKFTNCIRSINLITGKASLKIDMSDSLAKAAFLKEFPNKPHAWQSAHKIIQEKHLINYQLFKKIQIADDGQINALTTYTYFVFSGQDTGETRFYVLQQFDTGGKLRHTRVIDQITPPTSQFAKNFFNGKITKDTTLYFYTAASLWLKGDKLALDMIAFPNKAYTKGHPKGKRYFRGVFKLRDDGHFHFDHFYPDTLPAVYKNYNYNLENTCYSYNGQYFVLPLSDNLYSVVAPKEKIDLHCFSGKQYSGEKWLFNMSTNMANKDGNLIYVSYWLRKDQQIHYLKLNIKTGQRTDIKLSDKQTISKRYQEYQMPDPFDFNYFITPIAENKIIRYKVFPN